MYTQRKYKCFNFVYLSSLMLRLSLKAVQETQSVLISKGVSTKTDL